MNFRVSNSYTGCTPRGACCPTFGCDCGRCCRCAILAEGKDTFPRGAYAPRSWSPVQRASAGRKRFLRCTNARSQERRASARRGSADTFTQTQGRLLGKPPTVCGPITVAIACSDTTGGLRPPLLVGNASPTRTMRIPPANSTGTSLRPGTRPAHMRIACADSIRSPRGAYAPRSWLHGAGSPEKTTAAVRNKFRCEKRHWHCTNARRQERRA
jgi:hypothetical protein